MKLQEGPVLSQVTIRAEFITDDAGIIVVKTSRRNHYKVRLWIDGAPDDTYAVTYVLDDSYRDPIREVRDDPIFQLDTTTYGDYEMSVILRRRRCEQELKVRIADALAASYMGTTATHEILAALEDVRTH